MSHAESGDSIRLGTCIGHAMEPHERWGRLVGIVHTPDREIHRYIVREYAPGDGWFPTGGYRTTSKVFLIPHQGSCVPYGEQNCQEEP